ncbi:MAG: hypothetical protein MUF71_15155 [Candidatus Kapabacteria bacterium]|nr:hypothetical protein [Candidatus Kapabacteria bacterium]
MKRLFGHTLTESQAQQWARQREQGKWLWSAKYGVLLFAPITFVIKTLLSYNGNNAYRQTPNFLAVDFAVTLIMGLCWGLTMWSISEKNYQRYLAEQQNSLNANDGSETLTRT